MRWLSNFDRVAGSNGNLYLESKLLCETFL